MIEYIEEINRLLDFIEGGDQGSTIESVEKLYSSDHVIRNRFPSYNLTVDFASNIGLIELNSGKMKLTPLGKTIIDANPKRQYELTPEQVELLASRCFITERFRPFFADLVRQFSMDYGEGTYSWSQTDDPPLRVDEQLLKLMVQSDIIRRTSKGLKVNPMFARITRDLVAKTLSPQRLQHILEIQNKVGEIAEEIALIFERSRLLGLGRELESKLVRHTSTLSSDAGYDIESFNAESPNFLFDRFIEVKGSTDQAIRFFWSSNEKRVATELRERYFIYFVGGVDLKQESAPEVRMFQDPVYSILQNSKFRVEPASLLIEEIC